MERALSVEFEVVTPAYAGSANTKETEGLRPPTLKALLRFWWRAMNAHLPYDRLAAEEARLFGSTDTGQGILIRPRQGGPTGGVEEADQVVDRKDEWHWYSAYGAVQWNQERQTQVTQTGRLLPGPEQSYCFEVSIPPSIGHNEVDRALQAVRRALWLLSTLGGFGMRSRRGWGSLQVVGDLDGLPNLRKCATREQVISAISTGLRAVCPQPPPAFVEHTALTRQATLLVGASTGRASEALMAIIEQYRKLRKNLGAERNHASKRLPVGEDFLLVNGYRRKPVSGGDVTQGAAFGLPHNYGFTEVAGGPRKVNIEVFAPDDPRGVKAHGSARRASPVLFKVIKTGINEQPFLPLVAWLPAHFVGPTSKIVLNRQVKEPSRRGATDDEWEQTNLAVPASEVFRDRAIVAFLGDETAHMATDLGFKDFEGLRKQGWDLVAWS